MCDHNRGGGIGHNISGFFGSGPSRPFLLLWRELSSNLNERHNVAPGWVLHPRKQRSGSRIVPATRPGGPSPTGHKGPRHPPWSQSQPWGPRPPCPVTQPSYLPTRTPTGPPSGVSLVSAKEDMHVHGRKNQSSNGRGVHVTITSRSGQESGVRPARPSSMMMILLLFLQKQNLVSAIYLFGLGTRLSGPGLKHMRSRSHHDPTSSSTGALVIPLLLGRTRWSTKSPAC